MLRVHNKNCLLMTADLQPGSVDVVVTSPPYKEEDGYNELLIESLGWNLKDVLKDQGLAFVNFRGIKEDPGRTYWVQQMLSRALTFCFDIIWVFSFEGKGRFNPQPGDWRPHRFHEKVMVFANTEDDITKLKLIDRLAIGVPYTDPSNTKRFKHVRQVRCAGDVWFIPYPNKTGKEGLERGHHYGYPPELVRRCLLLAGATPGWIVLDPFCGGGTTLWVADHLGLDAVSYEVENRWHRDVSNRVRLLNWGQKQHNPVVL